MCMAWGSRGLRRYVPRIVACDLGSKASFAAAGATVHLLMERLGYSHESKRQCPVNVLLVGNKVACTRHAHATHTQCTVHAHTTHAFLAGRQVDVGARRQVEPTDCGLLLVRYVQPGMLLPQIRKLRLAQALLRVVARAVQYKRSALEGQKDKSLGGVPTMGDEISIELFKAMQVLPPLATRQPRLTAAAPPPHLTARPLHRRSDSTTSLTRYTSLHRTAPTRTSCWAHSARCATPRRY
jgi:hypothetical protein